MLDLLIAFVTGLTTGGLSCLAVQGGLLASSLANQLEMDVAQQAKIKKNNQNRKHIAAPILIFLAAKLAAYTLLGVLLGLLGTVFELTPMTRAILQFAIGFFMIGSGLRMLNVHPIFRYFAFEPPASLRRFIRKRASKGTSALTPAFLGLLTVLIPCGITQAMMAVAVSTADPLKGAALLFSFVLGTSPVFFLVSYFAVKLGTKMEKSFMRVVAVVLLLLGIFAIDTGLNLAGSPISVTRFAASLSTPASETFNFPSPQPEAEITASVPPLPEPAITGPEITQVVPVADELVLNVRNNGYQPRELHAAAGKDLQLKLVSKGTQSCSLAFVIPALNIQKLLQPTGVEVVHIPAQEKGTVMPFSCSMGMYTGQIIFD